MNFYIIVIIINHGFVIEKIIDLKDIILFGVSARLEK